MLNLVVCAAFVVWYYISARSVGKSAVAWSIAGGVAYLVPQIVVSRFILAPMIGPVPIENVVSVLVTVLLASMVVGALSAVGVRWLLLNNAAAAPPLGEEPPGTAAPSGVADAESLTSAPGRTLDLKLLVPVAAICLLIGIWGAVTEWAGPTDPLPFVFMGLVLPAFSIIYGIRNPNIIQAAACSAVVGLAVIGPTVVLARDAEALLGVAAFAGEGLIIGGVTAGIVGARRGDRSRPKSQ